MSWEPAGRPETARAACEALAKIYRSTHGEASTYAELPDLSLAASGHNNQGVSYHFLGKADAAEIGAVYPQTMVQTCIVHLIRNSLAFVSWKDRKSVIQGLKHVYRAATAELALEWLDGFEKRWRRQYPTIAPMWRRAWDYVTPLFAFPPAIRNAGLRWRRPVEWTAAMSRLAILFGDRFVLSAH